VSSDTSNVVSINPGEIYLNKELSWLEFNGRVLEEALFNTTPLLEKLKFLSIFSTNLDEYFMVRVAGLKKMEQEALRISDSPDGMETSVVLSRIRQRTMELTATQVDTLHSSVIPELAKADIKILKMEDVSLTDHEYLDRYFESDVSPILTPLGFDPAHPFPFLVNQSLFLIVRPRELGPHSDSYQTPIGFVEIPSNTPRLIRLPSTANETGGSFVLLEDLIAANLDSLFFGVDIAATYTMRVIRNLDYNLLENKVVDLLKTMQREVVNREHQEVVKLEIDEDTPQELIDTLTANLQITDADVYKIARPLYIPGLMGLYHLPMENLKDPPFNPRLPNALSGNEDIFSVVSKGDLLVHHPYDSFYAVTEFLNYAAQDPNVVAIKQTLYRSAGDSPIIDSLITASENGKQVTAVVELKARFDEKNNISWARRLERAGVNVVFGFVGLKTHGKATLVVRREKNKLVRYLHVSTGNYNSSTAKLYTDVGLFTTNQKLATDVANVFNLITGFDVLTGAQRLMQADIPKRLKTLSISPVNMRSTIISHIEHEIEHHRLSGNGHIRAKMNALVDRDIIDTLYRASQAGVKIQLIVRSACCLRPGIPGISDNIEVISIVDRFLEHSRIFYFHAGGEENLFLSSADWMPRNMDRRIELLIPIFDQKAKERLKNEILEISWQDHFKARVLSSDGTYSLRAPRNSSDDTQSQKRFIELARKGGIQSMPYDIAIRYKPQLEEGKRPIAKKRRDRKVDKATAKR
jgi:polyphosphate kinase